MSERFLCPNCGKEFTVAVKEGKYHLHRYLSMECTECGRYREITTPMWVRPDPEPLTEQFFDKTDMRKSLIDGKEVHWGVE